MIQLHKHNIAHIAAWFVLGLLGATGPAHARIAGPDGNPNATPQIVTPGEEQPEVPVETSHAIPQVRPAVLTAVLLSGKYQERSADETNPFTEELQSYAKMLTDAGVHVVQFDETNSDPEAIEAALRGAHFVIYSGPGDPLVGDWSLAGSGPSIRHMVRKIKLARGAIVIAHSSGLIGAYGANISADLARFRAAMYSGRFMLMGAKCCYVTVGSGGLSFLHDVLSGISFDAAFENGNAGGASRTAFRIHPFYDGRTLGLHTGPNGRHVVYDNVFAGCGNETLQRLFPLEAANLGSLSALDSGDTGRRSGLRLRREPEAVPYGYLSRGQYIASTALTFCGYRYVWGGTTPYPGFDCSGLVQYICHKWGLRVPRLAGAQSRVGSAITADNLMPGDLVFFKNTYKHGLSHVGIYIGNGRFVNAAGRKIGVIVSDLNIHDKHHWVGARRLNFTRLPRIAGEPPVHRRIALRHRPIVSVRGARIKA